MRRNLIIAGMLMAIFAAVFLFIKNQFPVRENENKEAPFEHFAFMRSYPDAALDIKAFNQAFSEEALRIRAPRSQNVLSWQQEGPSNIGGRITALAIHPTNTNVIYAGCPGGGLFKTTDGGNTWNPIFDSEAFLSISCITFDPQNSNIIFVGTGDPDTPASCLVGNGVYKSTDGGNTWTNIGLGNTGVITQIRIHPANSSIIYVSALGTPMVRDLNRGIYKSTNGGTNWSQVLSINNETGVNELILDNSNPNVLYATSWTRIRSNQESTGYSNASRVYKSTNAGANWTVINNGLPNTKLSRCGICMSNQNSSKLYVSVCDSNYTLEGIYVTTDAGATFSALPGVAGLGNVYGGFGWYFGKIVVKPNDDNDIIFSAVENYRSTDGGTTFFMNQPNWWNFGAPHADIHDIRFINSTAYILACDGGLYKTIDDGTTWTKLDNIPNTQFYKVNYNPFTANQYCGGAQDNGTNYGGFAFGIGNWLEEWGGDGFQPRIDFSNNQIRYAECQNGDMYVSTDGGSNYNSFTNGINWIDRTNWDQPYIFGANNTTVMYTGTYRVYKNASNPNANWTTISNDLTDGVVYAPRFHNISCIDNSKLNTQILYAGTSDGNVWRSLNDGGTWTNLNSGLPDRYVTSVKASPNVTNNVYVTVSGYKYNEYIPHIHKSTNNGTNWTDISGDLPQAGINDLIVAPGYENVLFVATDLGVYYTQNGGTNWFRLGNNMPVMVVWDLEFNPQSNKLIAGTYARGIQTIDISSLLLGVGLKESKNESEFSIYPNPAKDVMYLELPTASTFERISIYDIEGRKVKEKPAGKEIDVSELKSGIYNVVLENAGEKLSKKLYKQ